MNIVEIVVFGLFLFFFIVDYVVTSVTLFLLARKEKTKHSWLAFIPLANYFLAANIGRAHIIAPIIVIILVIITTLTSIITDFMPLFFQDNYILVFFLTIGSMIGLYALNLAKLPAIVYIWWRICEKRNIEPFWSLVFVLEYIPFVGFVGTFCTYIFMVYLVLHRNTKKVPPQAEK